MEEVASLIAQSYRLLELAKQAGIEPSWQLLVFMGASWLLVEVAKRAGIKGGCIGCKIATSAWNWAMNEKPLAEGEQALIEALKGGAWSDERNILVSRDGRVRSMQFELTRPRVWVDNESVEDGLSKECLKRAARIVKSKHAEHRKAMDDLVREAAQVRLRKLKTKV